jgi:hypothetical protein
MIGRSILSVQLAIGFAVAAVLVLSALGRAGIADPIRLDGNRLDTAEAAVHDHIDGMGAVPGGLAPASVRDGVTGSPCGVAARPAQYQTARVGIPPELLDALPLWRGVDRQDCRRGAALPRAQRGAQRRRAQRARA